MTPGKTVNGLTEALEKFASGRDRSKQLANRIEDMLISDPLRENPKFDDLRDVLASFAPGGGVQGERLYGEVAVAKECAATLKSLENTRTSTREKNINDRER